MTSHNPDYWSWSKKVGDNAQIIEVGPTGRPIKSGQDWMFNSTARREVKKGRLHADEWAPSIRAQNPDAVSGAGTDRRSLGLP